MTDLAELSTLPNNPGDSRFQTVSPGLLRLESEFSRLIAKVCRSCRLNFNKIFNILHCLSYLTVNVKCFLIKLWYAIVI